MTDQNLPCGCDFDAAETFGFHRKECEHDGAAVFHRHGCQGCEHEAGEMPRCWDDAQVIAYYREILPRPARSRQ